MALPVLDIPGSSATAHTILGAWSLHAAHLLSAELRRKAIRPLPLVGVLLLSFVIILALAFG